MRVVSFASGSKGNATLVETDGGVLLVDCGVLYRTLKARAGGPLPPLAGILLTHSHTDHTQGLAVFLRHHPEVPVYANALTAEAVAHDCGLSDESFVCFENGQDFDLGPFAVHPFSIPHDTNDPVGYLVRAHGETYFHATDVGTPLASIGLKLREADVATLESNHDPVMLRTSGRPPSLIQRIAGPRGHLSNEQACELVRAYASPRLKRLGLGHLSQDCNAPHVAEEAMRRTLDDLGRTDVALKVFCQDAVVEL